MNNQQILNDLEIFSKKFISYEARWIDLKNNKEFHSDISHNSRIRDMYAEGRSCASYLKNDLRINDVNIYTTLEEYINRVELALPDKNHYQEISVAAEKEIIDLYPANYTVIYMLNLFREQENHFHIIANYLNLLKQSNIYNQKFTLTAVDVVLNHAKHWEQNAQLHLGLNENALKAQLVMSLQAAGFAAKPETHAFQGHADICIPSNNFKNPGNIFVAECKIWNGQAHLSEAFSQLCRYVTPNDEEAALILFVKDGNFHDVQEKSMQTLSNHSSFSDILATQPTIQYSLVPAQNLLTKIKSHLILCNLTTPRY